MMGTDTRTDGLRFVLSIDEREGDGRERRSKYMIRDDTLQLHGRDDLRVCSRNTILLSKGGKHAFKLHTRIIVYRKYALYASRDGRLWSTNDHGVCSCNIKNLQHVADS